MSRKSVPKYQGSVGHMLLDPTVTFGVTKFCDSGLPDKKTAHRSATLESRSNDLHLRPNPHRWRGGVCVRFGDSAAYAVAIFKSFPRVDIRLWERN